MLKRMSNNEVDGWHQAWHEHVRFGGGRRPRRDTMKEGGTEPLPGIMVGRRRRRIMDTENTIWTCGIMCDMGRVRRKRERNVDT